MDEVEKRIRAAKRYNRNVFQRLDTGPSFWMNWGIAFIGSSVIGNFFNFFLGSELLATLVLTGITALASQQITKAELPKPFEPQAHFVGICTPEQDTGKLHKAFIDRKKEKNFIKGAIKAACKIKNPGRRGLCVVGASGCGKSILLAELKHELSSEGYKILDFSDCFYNVGGDVWRSYESRVSSAEKGHGIAVFDQFEQVLLMDRKARAEILAKIAEFAKRGIIPVFALREEYLQLFVEHVDLRCLHHTGLASAGCSKNIRVSGCLAKASGKNARKRIDGDDSFFHRKKYPDIILIGNSQERKTTTGVAEAMRLKCEGMLKDSSVLKDLSKCDSLNSTSLYEPVQDRPLIVQQALLNMLEQPDKMTSAARDAYFKADLIRAIKCYYDVQLCSTGAYFYASGIMYILAMSSLDHVRVSMGELKDALCIREDNGGEQLRKCVRVLIGRNLVKQSAAGEGDMLEVSHDYIVQSYEIYANTELMPGVKSSLDDWRSWNMRRREMGDCEDAHFGGAKTNRPGGKGRWAVAVCVVALILVLLRYAAGLIQPILATLGIANTVASPWFFGIHTFKMMDGEMRQYLQLLRFDEVPVSVAAITVFSIFYIFLFFRNITQHYGSTLDGKGKSAGKRFRMGKCRISLLYLFTMACGVAAVWSGDGWLFWLGLGNLLNGTSVLLVSFDARISANGRRTFRAYGNRTMCIGGLLIAFSRFLTVLPFTEFLGVDVRMLMEMIAMASLLAYSFIAHINREFFYIHQEPLLHLQKTDIKC